jgi:hypothetical protein
MSICYNDPLAPGGDFITIFVFVKGFFRTKAKKSEPPKWLALCNLEDLTFQSVRQ